MCLKSDQFERTMNAEIPEDFSAPKETDKIKEKLLHNHLVIVAGQNNSLYAAAALTAVKDTGYNEKRCVEMQRSSDWRHVDSEDVEFVLCHDPFGRDEYDEEKAKGMASIFSSIQQTVKEDRDDKKLAILMTSDIGVLNECKERHYHDILEEVVTVYHSTSATQPADLTVARCNKTIVPSTSTISQNLAESNRKAAANDVPNYTAKKQRLCDVQDSKRKVDETVEPRYPSKKQRVCSIQEKGPVCLPFQVTGVNDNQSADRTTIECLGTSPEEPVQ